MVHLGSLLKPLEPDEPIRENRALRQMYGFEQDKWVEMNEAMFPIRSVKGGTHHMFGDYINMNHNRNTHTIMTTLTRKATSLQVGAFVSFLREYIFNMRNVEVWLKRGKKFNRITDIKSIASLHAFVTRQLISKSKIYLKIVYH